MPMEAGKSTLKFWGESARGYKEGVRKELNSKQASDKWIMKILENAPNKEKLKILDIGCGPGFFTINLTKLGHDVIGIDVSKEMVDVASENAQEQGLTCDFKVMNANDLDFPDDTFDLIINRVVTWTLPDLYECYREWRRVLAPNGRLIVFDSNHYANLFDEERADEMRLMMRQHILDGKPDFTDHFDFHVRWSYWGDCPMIGTPRPKWDRNMLYKLCFVDIYTEENLFGDTHGSGTTEPMFMIRAEKPSTSEENEYIVNEYWNSISGCISARTVKVIEGGQSERYVDDVCTDIPKGSRILDMGTGSGAVAIGLSKKGYDVVGIDRAHAMVRMAKLTAEEMGVKVDFKEMDAECTEFEDSSFDAVVLRDVLWNSFSPEKILIEAKRLLKDGGSLIITDGNWRRNIRNWTASNPDSNLFPNYRKRDLGYGAYDIIDKYYDKLPLSDEVRPDWDRDVLSEMGMTVSRCFEYLDPMIADDLRPVLGNGFTIIAKK